MNSFMNIAARYPKAALFFVCCVLLAVLYPLGMVATVVPIGGGKNAADSYPSSGIAFDAKAYVARIWDKKVVSAAREGSVPLSELLAAIAKNKTSALHKYGHDVSGTYNMFVRFSGKVTRIDTSTPMGTMTVDVSNDKGVIPVKVEIGPVILGATLRDALKFISFETFLNQVQFGNVAVDLNEMTLNKVIAPLKLKRLKGHRLKIYGAYRYDSVNPKNVTVVPVVVSAGNGALL